MGKSNPRKYSCRDDELPMLCQFAASNLKNDLADFMEFSSQFSSDYLEAFEARITEVMELTSPRNDLLEQIILTQQIYQTLDELITVINRLTGYLTLSGLNQEFSIGDFGIKKLRKGIKSRDAEGVIKSLHLILQNIGNNKERLAAQGDIDAIVGLLTAASASIENDKDKQYVMYSTRRLRVQNNLVLFNSLFKQLSEILYVGKILYKGKDSLKLQEYTFTELKKNVRRKVKHDPEKRISKSKLN